MDSSTVMIPFRINFKGVLSIISLNTENIFSIHKMLFMIKMR